MIGEVTPSVNKSLPNCYGFETNGLIHHNQMNIIRRKSSSRSAQEPLKDPKCLSIDLADSASLTKAVVANAQNRQQNDDERERRPNGFGSMEGRRKNIYSIPICTYTLINSQEKLTITKLDLYVKLAF